jgi:SAM-dependent methyltransferase
VACGLTEYLDKGGVYRGFDVARELVDWCEEHITPRHPNFRFQHANIRARSYNPHGRVEPTAYRFPYADGVFDVALASSVFTHMRPESVEHYMAELARVLNRGGRLICSHFLINAASLQAIEKKTTVFNFCYKMGTCRTFDPQQPEEGLAYEEPYALDLFAANGFHIRWPVHYGNWRRRRSRKVTQDWIVGVKK